MLGAASVDGIAIALKSWRQEGSVTSVLSINGEKLCLYRGSVGLDIILF